MRRKLRTGVAALMLICMGGEALAATANLASCATGEDMSAIRTAAVQQKLMVAAFACRAAKLYERFVITYRRELQASDLALQNFFRRLNGQTGTADYHTFKTRLANSNAILVSHDTLSFCAATKVAFDAAFKNPNRSLNSFLAAQTLVGDDAFSPCEVMAASSGRSPRR